ncbi:MAG: hypothetical protein ACTHJ5_12310 [Ilyomonas sp.]
MNQHLVSRIAISLLAIVMIAFGIYHFMRPENMVIYVPEFLPGGMLWVYIVGIAFILAGLSFITNIQVRLAGYLLFFLLMIFVLSIHLPNYLHSGSKELQQLALINLLKDTAIAAFALHVAANAPATVHETREKVSMPAGSVHVEI